MDKPTLTIYWVNIGYLVPEGQVKRTFPNGIPSGYLRLADASQVDALVLKLRMALVAQMTMRDMKKPRKLEEELSWRDNDELANQLAEDALKASGGLPHD